MAGPLIVDGGFQGNGMHRRTPATGAGEVLSALVPILTRLHAEPAKIIDACSAAVGGRTYQIRVDHRTQQRDRSIVLLAVNPVDGSVVVSTFADYRTINWQVLRFLHHLDNTFSPVQPPVFAELNATYVPYVRQARQARPLDRRWTPSDRSNARSVATDQAMGEPLSSPRSQATHSGEPISITALPTESPPVGVFRGYRLIKRIAGGGMAESYQAIAPGSTEFVFLKRVRTDAQTKAAIEREMAIYDRLTRMRNPHILQFIDVVRDSEYAGFVTEWADGGNLETFVRGAGDGGLPPSDTKAVAVQIAGALTELHSHEVVHRDLKPGNVMRVKGQWKLADFGISKNQSRLITKHTFQSAGTRGYAAPEQLQGVEARPCADIYSLGKVVVFLLTGQTDVDHVWQQQWQALVSRCSDPNPDKRPSAQEMLRELQLIRT